jgi:hypothetical protein
MSHQKFTFKQIVQFYTPQSLEVAFSNPLEPIPIVMDDLYQLTAEAVNQNISKEDAEQHKQRQEQEDVVLKAFNNFGFSKRWDSLLDTVKKQVMSYG